LKRIFQETLDVITVQERWIGARVAYLDMQSRRLINRINLHLALGGSFDGVYLDWDDPAGYDIPSGMED
jgi:outer membrane protein TolC